jgi:hypothetical protein
MTTRLQVTFKPEEHRRAKRRAAELGISLAEFVRRSVDQALDEPGRSKRHISEIFGIGNSGGSNVAKLKDQYVGEAIEADYLKTKRTR